MENENHPFTSDAPAAPASTLPPSAETAAIASMIAGAAGEELGAEELAPAAALLEAASSDGAPAGAPGGMPAVSLEEAMTAADLKLANLPRNVRVRLHMAGLLRAMLEEIGEETKARTPPGQPVEIDPGQFWAQFVLPVFSVLGVELQELGCYSLEDVQSALILAWTSPPDLGGVPPG